ncbi:PAS domain-containing protein [Hymenobacter sp.]|uniref:sensor histidine kinase n=1 Tax=Hymenobacter sp. TaxID=1898978 RepID=UPI002ED7778F
MLDNDGNIVASSVGIAELWPAAVPAALAGRPLQDAQSQLGPVATAWAYAHSVVRSTPWVQPPVLLPVAWPIGNGKPARWWQPSLTRIALSSGAGSYWLATAHVTASAVPEATTSQSPDPDEIVQLRDALAHLPGYVLTLRGPEFRISYASPKLASLLGQEELVNRSAAEVLNALQASDALSVITSTYQTGQPFVVRELLLPGSEAAPHYFNVSLRPLRDANQQITGVLVFAQDVTNRFRTAATAAVATAPFQEIVEHLPQITSISSAEGVVEYLSPQWFAYTGQSTDVLYSHDWVDALNSDDWTEVLQELPEHLRKGEAWSWQARIRRYDGEYRLHLAHMEPERNEAGRISRWFGTLTDIQDQSPSPDTPRPDSLQEDPCKELTDNLPQLLWTLKPDGTPDTLNQAAIDYIGPDAQPSTDQGGQQIIPGDDVVQALIDRQHNLGANESWEYQSQIERYDGEIRWFLHRAQPLRDANGTIVKWYGTSTDIQELKQANLQLQQQNEDLLRNNRELDAFVQAAASELRQPIHNLQALFGQMREAVTFHDPDANALLVMADNSLTRWNNTVRNLMQLVKALEQHQLPAEELSLATVTREALLGLHPHLRASGGEVSTHFQSLPTVSYVRPHLLSIITNLLSNSIRQHDPSRPLRLRLESKHTANGRAQLVVQDNGLGMEPSRSTSRSSRTQPAGSGAAGLYLIHRIVEDHGGHLEVESIPGKGTTFCVTL